MKYTYHLYVEFETAVVANGMYVIVADTNRGNIAPHRIVLLKSKLMMILQLARALYDFLIYRKFRIRKNNLPYFSIANQTGHCIKGLRNVARLICQAIVAADHSGLKALKAEFAIGFHSTNTEFCKNARQQNIPSNI